MTRFRRILVGWDGSADAAEALRVAAALADGLHSEVVTIQVIEARARRSRGRETHNAPPGAPSEMIGGLEYDLRFHHETIESEHAGPAIGDYATGHGFDLVVVGRHGSDRTARSALGRQTEHLVRRSGLPVVVVAGAD